MIRGTAPDDGAIPHATVLIRFADAFFDAEGDLAAARAAVEGAVGTGGLVDAAGIVGIFNAVVRIADATGIPLEDYKVEASRGWRAELGIDEFASDHDQH